MTDETWWELAKIGLTAAVTTAGTFAVTWYTLRRSAEKEATARDQEIARHAGHLAVQVVCSLDRFVRDCCELVGDDGQPDKDGYLEPTVSAPSISLPKDVDWKSISPELAFRIMSIDHRVEYADQTIRAVGDLVAAPPDYEEYFEERIAQYAEVGLAAFALANELRQTYRIPNSEVGSWEPKVRLGKAAAGIKKSRKAARKRNAEEWKAMSSERETTKKT